MLGRTDWKAFGLGVTLILLIGLLWAGRPPQIEAVEEAIFDQYQRWEPRAYDPDGVVRVVDIDEASLRELGQWPWPRTFLAELVRRLANAGAAAIAFDMTFAEPDRTSPANLASTLRRFGDDYQDLFESLDVVAEAFPGHDESFGWMISQTPVILGVIADDAAFSAELPATLPGVAVAGHSDDLGDILTHYEGVIRNLDVLSEGAAGIGSISLTKREGAIIRKVPMVVTIGDRSVPTLAIEALRVAQAASTHVLRTSLASGETEFRDQARVVSMKTGGAVVPLDADATLRVRYSGAEDERVIPAYQLLEPGGLPPEIANDVAGRIILVGSSAAVLFDVKTTPLTQRISGVHVHAEIIEQIIAGEYLTYPDWAPGLERLAMALGGILVVALLSINQPILAFLATVLLGAALTGGSWLAFSELDLLVSPVAPMAGVLLPYFAVSGYKFITAEAGRREITRQFEHFISPEVIEDIVADPDRFLTPGGAQRTLTIMFLDVRSFSTITEKMPPQEVIQFLNDLLTPLTDTIIDHEGTIDKYMGDAIMAFWNAPRETPDHEIKAVRAMLALGDALAEVNRAFTARGLLAVEIGVGLNTGPCSVGNMGSNRRLAYSCVGDSVNLASRIEGQTKAYGVKNLVGAATAAALPGFAAVEIDVVAVKGREQPETVYTIAGDETMAETPEFLLLAGAIAGARFLYLDQQWDIADEAYREIADMASVGMFDPKPYAAELLKRVAEYRENPPPADWDGVYVATSK